MDRFEFCGNEWIGAARDYLLGASKEVDLSGINVAFNEVFTDPPAELDPDGAGRIGWFVRVADGRLEVGAGILAEADLRILCDYQTVLPAARHAFSDGPLGETIQGSLMGAIVREGDPRAMESLDFMAGLHDAMAVRTR